MQINSALTQLVNDKNLYITDMFGRLGHLVNIGPYYMFQPIEIHDEQIDRYERSRPLAYKRDKLIVKIPKDIPQPVRTNIIPQLEYLYKCSTEDIPCDDPWASQMFSSLEILLRVPFNIPMHWAIRNNKRLMHWGKSAVTAINLEKIPSINIRVAYSSRLVWWI